MSLPHLKRITGSTTPLQKLAAHTMPRLTHIDPNLLDLMLQDRTFIEEKRAIGQHEKRFQ